MISIIVAKSINNVIGYNNKIPWYLPEDLKRFKEITQDSTVIMGRKTFESIGKPLPNRLNIVISNTLKQNETRDIIVSKSLVRALLKCPIDKKIFIIGGQKLFQESLDRNIVDVLYITDVLLDDIQGDAFFPEISTKQFMLRESSEIMTDSKSKINFLYKAYEKI